MAFPLNCNVLLGTFWRKISISDDLLLYLVAKCSRCIYYDFRIFYVGFISNSIVWVPSRAFLKSPFVVSIAKKYRTKLSSQYFSRTLFKFSLYTCPLKSWQNNQQGIMCWLSGKSGPITKFRSCYILVDQNSQRTTDKNQAGSVNRIMA